MKAVLLGGSGFIGAHLSKALAKAGHEVVPYDYRKPVLSPQWPDVRYVEGDLLASDTSSLPRYSTTLMWSSISPGASCRPILIATWSRMCNPICSAASAC